MSYPPHGITAEVLSSVLPEGTLDPATPNIQAAIDAAVSYLRHEAGWHVFPAVDDTLIVDGEGGRVLTLPTLRVNSIDSVTERGGDPLEEWSQYEWSRTGDLKKLAGCWTTTWRGITVQLNHGYDLEDAAVLDLLQALASAVAHAAVNPIGIPEVIGPFQFTGGTSGSWTGDAATTLGRFKLPWSA